MTSNTRRNLPDFADERITLVIALNVQNITPMLQGTVWAVSGQFMPDDENAPYLFEYPAAFPLVGPIDIPHCEQLIANLTHVFRACGKTVLVDLKGIPDD